MAFSNVFSPRQRSPILSERKLTTGADDALQFLLNINNTDENVLIVEIPLHTKDVYILCRLVFNQPLKTFLYMLNKAEFFQFEK
jgi:hypothetical protein